MRRLAALPVLDPQDVRPFGRNLLSSRDRALPREERAQVGGLAGGVQTTAQRARRAGVAATFQNAEKTSDSERIRRAAGGRRPSQNGLTGTDCYST